MNKIRKFKRYLLCIVLLFALCTTYGIAHAEEKHEVRNVSDITSPGSYKLVDNITISQTMVIQNGDSYLIDLNGYKIESAIGVSSQETTSVIKNYGVLTVKDSSTGHSGEFVSDALFGIVNYNQLTVESGIFKSDVIGKKISSDKYAGRIIRNEGTLTINGGTFNAKGGPLNTRPNSTTTINGGTFTSTSSNRDKVDGETGYYTYCVTNGGKMIINDATIRGIQGALATYTGELYVYDGHYSTQWNDTTSYYALYIAGEAGNSKGYIYGGHYSSPQYAAYIGNDGDGGIYADANVIIYNGEFVGKKGSVSFDKLTAKDPQIKGGHYFTSMSEDGPFITDTSINSYLDSDYQLTDDGVVKKINPDSLTLDKTTLKLKIGKSIVLNVSVLPDNVLDKTVSWQSSHPDIASVDSNGKVMAYNQGTSTITTKLGNKTASCIIKVEKADDPVLPPFNPSKPVDDVTIGITDDESKEIINDTGYQLIQDISNGVAVDESVVSSETLEKIKEAIADGKTITFKVESQIVSKTNIPVAEINEIDRVINSLASENKTEVVVAQYLDLGIALQAGNEKLGNFNKLDGDITFTVAIPDDLKSEERKFYVVRIHDGVSTILNTTQNADGTISFDTDSFSTYALVYEDQKAVTSNPDTTKPSNPVQTNDSTSVVPLMIMFGLSVFIGTRQLFIKKKYTDL